MPLVPFQYSNERRCQSSRSEVKGSSSSFPNIAHQEPFVKDVTDGSSLHTFAQQGRPCTNEKGQPLVQLDPTQEAALRHKIDWHLLPICGLAYLLCFLDRANLGNARIAGLEKDLGMDPHSYQFNFLVMSFYVPYAVCEPPSILLCKRIGPGIWLPLCVTAFGITTLCFAFVDNMTGAIIDRIFLGVAEAAMMPGFAYYLSRWYRKNELDVRISAYIAGAVLAGGLGGLLASAILTCSSIGSLHRWRMIFLVEGLITTLVGLSSYFLMPDRIESARWLSDREKSLALARIKSDNVATSTVVDQFRRRLALQGLFNPTSIACGVLMAISSLTAQSVGYMLPTIIKLVFPGHTVTQQQLFSTPPYFVGTLFTVVLSYVTVKTQKRALITSAIALLAVIGYGISLGTTVEHAHARYAATFFIVTGSMSLAPMLIAWSTANCNSDTERAGAVSMLMFISNLGAIASAWSYLPADAPNYHRANLANVILSILVVFVIATLAPYLRHENRRRDRGERNDRLNGLTWNEQEILGHLHPAFRYHC